MGLLDRIFQREEKRDLSLTNYAQWVELGLTSRVASGISVTENSALTSSAVFGCVRVLAETVASLPLIVYQRVGEGKERAPDHYLYNLLHDRPNEFMTSFEFRETLMGHLTLWGNAYTEIEYDARGRTRQLWPLRPDRMLRVEMTADGRRAYQYMLPSGETVWLSDNNVWHLRGFGGDGLNGYSVIRLMRESIGLGLAAESFGARFFGNDARPGGILEHPGVLGEEAHKRLRESWESRHGGLSGSHRVAILEEGLQYKQIGIPPEDAQFLETRRFQVIEIARAFRVPPHMLGDLERATFSNIEHQSIDFVVHTIRPWLVRWEQSIQQRLMLAEERERFYAEFLVDGLLRGDTQTRYQAYAVGRQNGWLSANDIRELENMNPVEGGDVYLVPLNMVPAGEAGIAASRAPVERQKNHESSRIFTNKEDRDRAIGQRRRGLMDDFLSLFEDVFGRLVRREVADVKRAANKYLKKGDLNGFVLWMDGFYEEHQSFVAEGLYPALVAYAAAIVKEIQAELQSDVPAEPGQFVNEYTDLYALRYANKQRQALMEAIRAAQEAEQDILEAITERMDYYDEARPGQESRRELHRFNNAMSIITYAALGVLIKRWVTLGDSCPYCRQLDGVTVEIHSYFMGAGSTIEAEGKQPLEISVNMGHPPAHDGCDCMVIAG